MAKDYAKNKNKKKKSGASRGKKKKGASGGLIFTAFLLVAALVSFLVYLKWYRPPALINNQNISKTSEKKPQQKKLPVTKKPQTDPKKDIEDNEVPFYKTHEELVNKTVEIPIEDLKLPDETHKYEYLMPCGSFRDSNRAEELKAKIAFIGFESKINQVNVESVLWHRVELGPFKSKRKAESIRHRLQDNGFDYCKIWRKKII